MVWSGSTGGGEGRGRKIGDGLRDFIGKENRSHMGSQLSSERTIRRCIYSHRRLAGNAHGPRLDLTEVSLTTKRENRARAGSVSPHSDNDTPTVAIVVSTACVVLLQRKDWVRESEI